VTHVIEEILPLLLDNVSVLGRTAMADVLLGGTERHQTQDERDTEHLRITYRLCTHSEAPIK